MELAAFLDTAVELLAVPSTADRPDQLLRALDLVVDFVGPGFVVERFESNGKPSALLYAEKYRAGPRPDFRLILNGHLDVVPAEPEQFRPRFDGGLLYARGTQDMKVSALAQALVFRELAATVPYPLALQLVADEEVGGQDGTLHQLDQGVTGEFVVIGEHSGLDIVADSKGMLHVKLHSVGQSAHGAYPWFGDNALVKLVNTVSRLLARYPPPGAEVWRTTVNVARIDTPNRTFNQIPDRAEGWLDLRFPTEDTDFTGRSVPELLAFLHTFGEPGVTFELDQFDPPHHADHDRPEIGELRRAAQAQGYPAEFVYKHGGSDGGFYSARGIATVAFGVGGSGQHGPHEHVELATIEPYLRALRDFLVHLKSTPAG